MILWTKKNDIVLSPFMGIGSEIYVAIKNKRKAIGIELKDTYYKQAVRHAKRAVEKRKESTHGII
jgi:DNA modification methylase